MILFTYLTIALQASLRGEPKIKSIMGFTFCSDPAFGTLAGFLLLNLIVQFIAFKIFFKEVEEKSYIQRNQEIDSYDISNILSKDSKADSLGSYGPTSPRTNGNLDANVLNTKLIELTKQESKEELLVKLKESKEENNKSKTYR